MTARRPDPVPRRGGGRPRPPRRGPAHRSGPRRTSSPASTRSSPTSPPSRRDAGRGPTGRARRTPRLGARTPTPCARHRAGRRGRRRGPRRGPPPGPRLHGRVRRRDVRLHRGQRRVGAEAGARRGLRPGRRRRGRVRPEPAVRAARAPSSERSGSAFAAPVALSSDEPLRPAVRAARAPGRRDGVRRRSPVPPRRRRRRARGRTWDGLPALVVLRPAEAGAGSWRSTCAARTRPWAAPRCRALSLAPLERRVVACATAGNIPRLRSVGPTYPHPPPASARSTEPHD